MVVEIEGVPLHLAHPDELNVTWVGQEEVMRRCRSAGLKALIRNWAPESWPAVRFAPAESPGQRR